MAQNITLTPTKLTKLHSTDPRLISYDIEMTEVTGGTFWKCYAPEHVSGEKEFSLTKMDELDNVTDFMDVQSLMEVFDPIHLYDEKIRAMAKGLGPAWVRVSGTWATQTYYDFDNHTGGTAPEGFRYVLTREQWIGLLDFVKATDAKLLVSVANSAGVHGPDGCWTPERAKLLFDFSRDYGVPIHAAEFMNEPNALAMSGAPEGYTVSDFARDQDLFFRFVRENYPDVLLVGPCGAGDAWLPESGCKPEHQINFGGSLLPTEQLLVGCKESADAFSYHYYNGVSERGAATGGHWDATAAHTEAYLAEADCCCRVYLPLCDQFTPGAQMWVTESGDAACGGNTWASTFLDVLRYANELGAFSVLTDGIIFHNTFCSSDYGLLDPKTHEPRPNYWLAYLRNHIMGTTVYAADEDIREGVHLYAHSRRDGKEGAAYVLINNSLTEATTVNLPSPAQRYTLSAQKLRSLQVLLNGKALAYDSENGFPQLAPVQESAGTIALAPATVTFLIL